MSLCSGQALSASAGLESCGESPEAEHLSHHHLHQTQRQERTQVQVWIRIFLSLDIVLTTSARPWALDITQTLIPDETCVCDSGSCYRATEMRTWWRPVRWRSYSWRLFLWCSAQWSRTHGAARMSFWPSYAAQSWASRALWCGWSRSDSSRDASKCVHTYCCLGLVMGQMVNDHTCHIVVTSHILHNVNPLIWIKRKFKKYILTNWCWSLGFLKFHVHVLYNLFTMHLIEVVTL